MDPLTAVSLASTVAQLIDFGIKIVELCHAFHKAQGDLPPELARARLLASDLLALMHRIQQQSQKSPTGVIVEQSFVAQVDCCLGDITTLHNLLASLNTANKLDAFNLRQAFRALRKSGEVSRLATSLEQYRDGISARLIQSTHETQQYVCEVIDRNRSESSQEAKAISDALDLLKSSITNTSQTISTDVTELLSHSQGYQSSLQTILQEVKNLGDDVDAMSKKVRQMQQPQYVVRTSSILQLHSARQRRRPRVRSSSGQLRVPHYSHSRSSSTASQHQRSESSEREKHPTIKFTLSVDIYGDPRDLVALLRNVFFTSWSNVTRPISAMLSSTAIPPSLDFSPPAEMDAMSAMLTAHTLRVKASYDSYTGVITLSSETDRILVRTRMPNGDVGESYRRAELPWNVGQSSPQLQSVVPYQGPMAHFSLEASEFLSIGDDVLSNQDLSALSDDGSTFAEPERDPIWETIELMQLADMTQDGEEGEGGGGDEVGGRGVGEGEASEAHATEAQAIDFSLPPSALPVINETGFYARGFLTGKTGLRGGRRRSDASSCSSPSTKRSRGRRREKEEAEMGWMAFLLCLLIPLSVLFCFGKWLDHLDGGRAWDFWGWGDSAVLRQQMYGNGAVGFWMYKPQKNVEETVAEEARLINEGRKLRERRARQKRMKERAVRCQSWGGCTKYYWDEIWRTDEKERGKGKRRWGY